MGKIIEHADQLTRLKGVTGTVAPGVALVRNDADDGWELVAVAQDADVTTSLAAKAPLASPVLTGTPSAPTAAAATSTTQIATTAFVRSATLTAGQEFTSISVQGSTGTLGPATIGFAEPLFNSERDPLVSIGVNMTPGGSLRVAGKAGLGINCENNYYTGGVRYQEFYVQFLGSNGTWSGRSFFTSHDTSADTLLTILKGDSIKGIFPTTGVYGESGLNGFTFTKNSYSFNSPLTNTSNILSVESASGQAAVLQLGYNGSNGNVQLFPQSGGLILQSNSQNFYFWNTPSGGAGSAMSIGVQDNGASITVQPSHTSMKALVARKKASNTNNIVEVQDTDGTTLFQSVDANGNTVIGNAALATNATNGFLYIPTCAGAPTGTPTSKTGRVPIVFDSTNLKIYVYTGGAWKATAALS